VTPPPPPPTPPTGHDTPPPPVVDLPDTETHFLPESANLRDPDATRASLSNLAKRIIAEHDTVALTGTTARVGPPDGQRDLGLARAEAIKTLLVQLGVPSQQITTHTVGSFWPGYATDHDANGIFLPGPGELNRHVIVELAAP
jgi:outer membrane protein OmpA-like peptidoglycan-associated protein